MLPIIFQNSNFVLYSYPLFMGMGWGVAYQIFFSLTRLPKAHAHFLFWGIFLFAWVGAKALFLLTSNETENLLFATNFWLGGGFVFYGGLISGLTFVLLYKLICKNFSSEDLWPILPGLTFGHAVGRIGCFMAGCCFGLPTSSVFGIHLHGDSRYPTQLFEALGLALLGIYLISSKASKKSLSFHYLIGYGALRLGTESLRGDIIRGHWGVLCPSQWISIILLATGILFFLSNKFSELRKSA